MKRSQIKQLLRNPTAMMRFQATGRLPDIREPNGPLIKLLESIPPRDRSLITGVKVGPALGYTGSRQFHTAGQALDWCKPANPGVHVAAESWQDKRFVKQLYLDDLLAQASRYPESLVDRLAHLLSPAVREERKTRHAAEHANEPARDAAEAPTQDYLP